MCGRGWSLLGLHPKGKLLALPENIRQGWKWLTAMNALAHYTELFYGIYALKLIIKNLFKKSYDLTFPRFVNL